MKRKGAREKKYYLGALTATYALRLRSLLSGLRDIQVSDNSILTAAKKMSMSTQNELLVTITSVVT